MLGSGNGAMQIPSVLATQRDAKCKRRTTLRTEPAWAPQNSKAIGQKCEKPWENLWFCSGEDRNRTFGCFSKVFR